MRLSSQPSDSVDDEKVLSYLDVDLLDDVCDVCNGVGVVRSVVVHSVGVVRSVDVLVPLTVVLE